MLQDGSPEPIDNLVKFKVQVGIGVSRVALFGCSDCLPTCRTSIIDAQLVLHLPTSIPRGDWIRRARSPGAPFPS